MFSASIEQQVITPTSFLYFFRQNANKLVRECFSIADVLSYSSIQNGLILFDLDNTVIMPDKVNDLGSD